MKLKEYLQRKRIRQIEIAKKIKAPMSVVNVYVNGWKPLPEKHLKNLSEFLGVTIEELRSGEISKPRGIK